MGEDQRITASILQRNARRRDDLRRHRIINLRNVKLHNTACDDESRIP